MDRECRDLFEARFLGPFRELNLALGDRRILGLDGRPPSVGGPQEDTRKAVLETAAADRDAVRGAAELRARGVACYLTAGGQRVRALVGVGWRDILALEAVGSHNARSDQQEVQVGGFVAEIEADLPFDVTYADEAGLELSFRGPVPPALARRWESSLLDRLERGHNHWLDSWSFMDGRSGRAGLVPDPDADPRGGGSVPAWICAAQAVRFWWD